MNVLPFPGALASRISPPSSRAISRLMASPSPVPPYFRLVLPSACWNASKMSCCLSAVMPMPVSVTDNASTPSASGRIFRLTNPSRVNLNEFDSRFLMICCRRLASVSIVLGRSGCRSMLKSSPLDSATCRKVRST